MSKKTAKPSSAKKANSSGSMGRKLFYSVALIVGCCAVAVVLFETETGQEFVAKVEAKVRGEKQASSVKNSKASEVRHPESETHQQSSESKNAEESKPSKTHVNDNLNYDTSAKQNEAKSSETKDEETRESAQAQEAMASESEPEIANESERESPNDFEPQPDEFASSTVGAEEKEDWELADQKIDEDEDVKKQNKPVEEKAEEEERPVEEQDKPVVEMEKPANEQVVEPVKPDEPVFVETAELEMEPEVRQVDDGEIGEQEFLEEKNMSDEQQNVPEVNESQEMKRKVDEKVDGGEREQGEFIEVGDSLAELENQRENELRKKKQKEAKQKLVEEERYEPILEPEGPPIDQSPLQARRGLRGDYGGKDCKDLNKNCVGWARIGECKNNPVWMHVNCKKSCNVCSCSDNDTKCIEWSKAGECKKNSEWMNKNCMKSCQQC